MFDVKLGRLLLVLGLFGSLYASSPSSLSQTVGSECCASDVKEYLKSVAQKHNVRDVAEVLAIPEYFVERFLYENIPYDCVKKAFLKYSTSNTLTIEAYLAQQYETVQIVSPAENVDRDWEERFQAATKSTSQLLLPQEFKNPVNINKYLAFLRGIDPFFEPWLHSQLHLHTISFASDVLNPVDNYRVYEAIRDYYRAGGAPLSVLLDIKVAEEKEKKKAAEWHFPWPLSGIRSTSTSSARSSDEGTPPNGSFGTNASGSEKTVEQQPLLAAQAVPGSEGLRHRHVTGPSGTH